MSRARRGLYVVGDFKCLYNACRYEGKQIMEIAYNPWKKILSAAYEKNLLTDRFDFME